MSPFSHAAVRMSFPSLFFNSYTTYPSLSQNPQSESSKHCLDCLQLFGRASSAHSVDVPASGFVALGGGLASFSPLPVLPLPPEPTPGDDEPPLPELPNGFPPPPIVPACRLAFLYPRPVLHPQCPSLLVGDLVLSLSLRHLLAIPEKPIPLIIAILHCSVSIIIYNN